MRKDARIRVQPCSITLRTLRPPRIRASDVGTLRVSISYISIPAPAPSGLAENKNKKIYLQFAIVYRWAREVGGSGQWLAGPINTPPFFAVTSPSFSTLYPSSSPPSSSPSPCPRRSPPLPVHVDVPQRALAQLPPLLTYLSPFCFLSPYAWCCHPPKQCQNPSPRRRQALPQTTTTVQSPSLRRRRGRGSTRISAMMRRSLLVCVQCSTFALRVNFLHPIITPFQLLTLI